MTEANKTNLSLTAEQKKILRAMGHHLKPVVFLGKEGLTPTLVKSTEAALLAHELIKIKVGQNCPMDRSSAGRELAPLTGAVVVQVIGRMTLLYRPNPDLAESRRIIFSSRSDR